jgi:5-oxoprolinase (ATP-hydrolysing) subunit A
VPDLESLDPAVADAAAAVAAAVADRAVDLNCDLGEGFGVWRLGDDQGLLDVVTSANVACGFHAGDPSTLRRVCGWAAERGVAVGAQVSYRDLAGFGRRFIDVEPAELTDEVLYQLGALAGLARVAGTRLTYLKPHGALYSAVVTHTGQAGALVEAVRLFDPGLVVLGLPGSAWLAQAREAGLAVVGEAFADRAYSPDGRLVPRGEPGAVLTDPAVIVRRCLRMVAAGQVEAVDGRLLDVRAGSICLHGDTPGAVGLARQVRAALAGAGVRLRAFAPPGPVRR